ncbi:hypothetical protein L210DRAFT_861729 [Boletus edulis BED1]|uniref:Uncharacterized protein n=1 Tax=Boletus edulis BED1 TaxID=1328754 RepID=A0AAD4BD88_BOLED|nr:hypothetical protein L210DRAFT_861729 [Boletus edulis BED1]
MEDLDEAIVLSREAVDLYSRGHCDRSMSSLYSVQATRGHGGPCWGYFPRPRGLDLRPKLYPDRSMSLNTLALRLSESDRFPNCRFP